ncbi:unnamed protein product [Nezara viridula]|uniref:PHD-type domain-containing protein n=1 Tax=Nezara viridula TaxID=85310 RepID=A0A9P0E0Y4_NEZVI|nr:unnamed protein product [Nezara viridula]
MSETPGRGYLPPTVPAPGPHRRQWPSFNYFAGQWQGKQPFIMAPSSPPQSESMDLSSRPEVNGGEVNGTGVSVIAPNPLIAEEKPGKLPTESARGFEAKPEPFIVSKTFTNLPPVEKIQNQPNEGTTPPNDLAESRTSPPVEEKILPQPEVPVEAPAPPSESAAHPVEAQKGIEAADHVESLLENMFQGETKPSVIVANCSRPPVLTDDKVVEILQDSSTPIKEEPKESQFMEVESELEKMFAGIEEEKPPIPPSTETMIIQPEKKAKKQSKPRQRKSTDSVEGKKRKAKRRERQRPKKTKREKENSNDSSTLSRSVRGPYVHVEGSKEAPQYVSVVNSAGKEEEEKDRGDRRKHQTLVEGRVKGSNLYSSTLSSRYNSQSIDSSWVCVFCKLRAHCEGGLGGEPAGDLFGPYILTVPKGGEVDRGFPGDKEVSAEQKKRGGGKAASLRATGSVEAFLNNFTKKNKKNSFGNLDEAGGEKEVWVHEKCAIWAPGIYLAGPHLVGLAEAVATSTTTKCSVCGEYGACVGCIRRGCQGRVHYGCGLSSGWHLNDDNFLSLCPNHIVKKEKFLKGT